MLVQASRSSANQGPGGRASSQPRRSAPATSRLLRPRSHSTSARVSRSRQNHRDLLVAHLHGYAVDFTEGAYRLQVLHSRATTAHLDQSHFGASSARRSSSVITIRACPTASCCAGRIWTPTLSDSVQLAPVAAGRILRPCAVDSDGVPGLHAVACRLEQRIGRRDDVPGGAVIGGQEGGLRSVVRLEAAEELHRGAVEGVDVLVVVTDREERELAVPVLQGPAGQRRYQLVLVRVDVLVLVGQNPAKSPENPLALLIGLLREQSLAPQQRHRLPHHLLERLAVGTFRSPAEAGAGQPHGEAVAGEHRHPAGIIAD